MTSAALARNFLSVKTTGFNPPKVHPDAYGQMLEVAKKYDAKLKLADQATVATMLLASQAMSDKEAQANAKAYFEQIDRGRKGIVEVSPILRDWKRMQLFKAMRFWRDAGEGKPVTEAELVGKLTNQLGSQAGPQAIEVFAFLSKPDTIQLKDLVRYYFVTQMIINENKNRVKGVHNIVPVSVLTDSYKAGHFLMYPDCKLMVCYGEMRQPYEKDKTDSRFVFYGFRYIIEKYIGVQWTEDDVEKADLFYRSHNAGGTPYPFPRDLFLKFVRENNGYFPVKIEALPEGTCTNFHVPVYQIWASGVYARLITFLETLTTQVWYPSNVATLSRRTKDIVVAAFDKSVEKELHWLVNSRLHDFGFRGASCVEASIIGGCAHLCNFEGSDTMSAAYYAQFVLNDGKPVASSIPATEHSVMTSWPTEKLAMENMIDKFGGPNAIFAIVMDSYNYQNALENVLGGVKEAHQAKGGLMVLRPDSGDPVECILMALENGERHFGATTNKLGFKVLNGVAAIQGDGIDYNIVGQILDAVLAAGFSAQNVAFGMGAGLLQKHNRDTMSFATKLNFIIYPDGTERFVMKAPKTDSGKISFPGVLKVHRKGGNLVVLPRVWNEPEDPENVLKVVYDNGPIPGVWDSFDEIRARINEEWPKTQKHFQTTSPELQKKIDEWIADHKKNYDKLLGLK